MATLQKTYTGDLSTAIAGKLYEAITDADEKNQLEDKFDLKVILYETERNFVEYPSI